jgi:hypothetical protein
MADDIEPRILISVEYADAVEKCKELETGLEQITKARQKDLNAAKTATQKSDANARAMEREAAAADKVADATERMGKATKVSIGIG